MYFTFGISGREKRISITIELELHPPESTDRVFLNECRVSLLQKYQKVHHNFYPLKKNENEM
jgi:hypothetical protein